MNALPLSPSPLPPSSHSLPGESVGAATRTAAYLKSMGRSTARLMLRRLKRHRAEVSNEYDQGHWARILSERAWERSPSLADFLIGQDQRIILSRIDDRVRRIKTADYYRYRLSALPQLLADYLDLSADLSGTEGVVELGCGVGFNLFALALAFPHLKLTGVDYSPNAIAAGRAIAAHFGLSDRIRFEVLDLTDPQHPGFALLKGQRCFTFFCIEQIPYEVSKVIRNILRAQPDRVLHIEPTIERLHLSKVSDWANLLYIKSVDYQTQLFSVLSQLNRTQEVRVLREARAPFSPTIQNDGFIISWSPAGSTAP